MILVNLSLYHSQGLIISNQMVRFLTLLIVMVVLMLRQLRPMVIQIMPPVSLYRELKFSVDNLSKFSSFRIKLIGTSTNQAHPPQIKNFRAIGLDDTHPSKRSIGFLP